MTAKGYLGQAYLRDKRSNVMLEQVLALRTLSQKITASYEGEPVSHTRNVTSMENTIILLMEAENDLNDSIDVLVYLKRDIHRAIQEVQNPKYQLLLELRYLCFKSWSEIAAELELEDRYVFKLHSRAL